MRSILPFATWLPVLLLTGCTALPGVQKEPEPRLTPSDLDTRLAELEGQLAARCEGLDTRFDQIDARQSDFTADIREVGSLLRHLNGDVKTLLRRGDEPVVVTRECASVEDPLDGKTLIGGVEWIGLPDVGTYLAAYVDTGATGSMLAARDITPFERDGEEWVRFKLALNDSDQAVAALREESIEAPIVRRVRGAANGNGRPVVSLLMTLGPLRQAVEFTLATTRVNSDYPVTLGRRSLLDLVVIDVAQQHVHPQPDFAPTDAAADTTETTPAPDQD